MNTNKRFITAALIAPLLIMLPLTVNSATFKKCDDKNQVWKSGKTTMHSTITAGHWTDVHTKQMMGEWNAVKGSNFKFSYARDPEPGVNNNNGVNEIYFGDTSSHGALGITYGRSICNKILWWWHAGGFTEKDIAMNYKARWTTAKYTGEATNTINYKHVMLHELGHALGLGHYDAELATMNTYYPGGGSIGYYNDVEPHADDRWGLRILYPKSESSTDLVATRFHVKDKGTRLNRVYDTQGNWNTNLKRGESYDIQYTRADLGTRGTLHPEVRFYFSTNDYISTSDVQIGSVKPATMGGFTFTELHRFTVPADLTPGKYHVGYIIDPASSYTEGAEYNNSVSLLHIINVY